MEVVEGGFDAQMRQVLNNLTAIVEASGSSLDKVVKTTVRFLLIIIIITRPWASLGFRTQQINLANTGIPQVDGQLWSYEHDLRFSL